MKRMFILLVLLVLVSAGCGGGPSDDGIASAGGDKPSTSATVRSSGDPDTARLRYARCLREQGVAMPDDPKDLPKGGLEIPDKARAACEKFAPPGRRINMDDPVVRERLARFARCMRSNGYDMPDNAPPDIHLKDPQKWEKASKVCNHILREGQ